MNWFRCSPNEEIRELDLGEKSVHYELRKMPFRSYPAEDRSVSVDIHSMSELVSELKTAWWLKVVLRVIAG